MFFREKRRLNHGWIMVESSKTSGNVWKLDERWRNRSLVASCSPWKYVWWVWCSSWWIIQGRFPWNPQGEFPKFQLQVSHVHIPRRYLNHVQPMFNEIMKSCFLKWGVPPVIIHGAIQLLKPRPSRNDVGVFVNSSHGDINQFANCQRLPQGKSHETIIFLRFSCGFPMEISVFSMGRGATGRRMGRAMTFLAPQKEETMGES